MDLQQIVQEKIEALTAKLDALNVSREAADQEGAKLREIMNGPLEVEEKVSTVENTIDMNAITASNDYYLLDNLKETATLNIQKVETRYLLTDQDELISPAGFHPDEKVFIQTGQWVQTNVLPKSSNMKAFDLEAA
tara:strand:+ start:918 stop:1325 length:408 start_codon:yes stop_codon:yes gene_type:complete